MGTDLKVTVSCGFCTASHDATVSLPDGWETRYGGADVEDGFCPQHAAVLPFAENQCPGCVSGWGDCPMWHAFGSSSSRTITNTDLATIESGVCPRRVNGTMSFSPRAGFQDINLSERAPPGSGKAFADAIREYIARYPSARRPSEGGA